MDLLTSDDNLSKNHSGIKSLGGGGWGVPVAHSLFMLLHNKEQTKKFYYNLSIIEKKLNVLELFREKLWDFRKSSQNDSMTFTIFTVIIH